MFMRWICVMVFGLLICGCDKPDFPDYSALGPLRILTVLANSPEASPGNLITLQPVISDVNGGGRMLTANYQACWDPGIGLGARPICLNPDINTSATFSGATLGSNNTYTGEAPSFTVNIPTTTFNSPQEAFNGKTYLVTYSISAGDGSTVNSFKRITVSDPSKTSKNQNPSVTLIYDNSVLLSLANAFSTAVQSLVPAFDHDDEIYQTLGADGSFSTNTELTVVTWFVSDGILKYDRTYGSAATEWTPSPKPGGRDSVLVGVVHDGRGGEGYKIYQFQ